MPPEGVADTDMPDEALGFRVQNYGLTRHRDPFTPRQLLALATFSDLVSEARARALTDGATEEYSDAIATYLGLAVSCVPDYSCTIATWVNAPNMEIQRRSGPRASSWATFHRRSATCR